MLLKHGGFVYIMTNKNNAALYTGLTSELRARVDQHKSKYYPISFTAKYNCDKIVLYEQLDYIEEAIAKEKQIKAGNRKTKESLINSINPAWISLAGYPLFMGYLPFIINVNDNFQPSKPLKTLFWFIS